MSTGAGRNKVTMEIALILCYVSNKQAGLIYLVGTCMQTMPYKLNPLARCRPNYYRRHRQCSNIDSNQHAEYVFYRTYEFQFTRWLG